VETLIGTKIRGYSKRIVTILLIYSVLRSANTAGLTVQREACLDLLPANLMQTGCARQAQLHNQLNVVGQASSTREVLF
jgi:hypothetical protein